MKIEYALTLADYRAALQLHNRQNVARRFGNFVLLAIAPALALLMILLWLYQAVIRGDSLANQPSVWIAPLVFVSLPLLREWSIRRCFKQLFPSSVTSRNVSFAADDDLIVSAIPDRSEGRFRWSSIDHFAQNKKITLFYVDKKRFLFLPTPAFSREQHAELGDLVARHGVKAFIC